MLSKTNSLFVLTVIITIVTSIAIAQEAKNVPVIEPAAARQPRAITFPYVAQVTGENVYTRAGGMFRRTHGDTVHSSPNASRILRSTGGRQP